MAKTATKEAPPKVEDPFGNDMGAGMADLDVTPAEDLPAVTGQDITVVGSVITAQKVAIPRNLERISAKLKVLCKMNGPRYMYSWSVKDRQNNRMQEISGPTVKLANDLAREYGNCWVGVDEVVDTPTHWQFMGKFVDLETGFTYCRPFQQAKDKNVGGGMRDAGRRDDLIYQIGASKAIRNVIVNALSTFTEYMMEESDSRLIDFVNTEADKANEFIDGILYEKDINIKRVEAVVGRTRKEWTDRDLVRVLMELRGVKDGLSNPDELYPTGEAAETVMATKQADKADVAPAEEGKAETKGKSKAKPKAAKKDEKPAKETVDEETGEVTETETKERSEDEEEAHQGQLESDAAEVGDDDGDDDLFGDD